MKALRTILGLTLAPLTFAESTASNQVNERPHTDPDFAPIEKMYLLFPMVEKDFWNWNSLGSAVFLEKKAVLAPEVSSRKGLIHTTQPNPKPDHWYAIMDFNIGREKINDLDQSGDGLAIYYLRNLDSGDPDINQNFYGFVDDFDGVGIFINTLMKQSPKGSDKKRKHVAISSFANNGRKMLKQLRPDTQCYREVTGNHVPFSKVAIEYEKPMLTVSVFDHESQQFMHCFSQKIELDYEGFFVISASSGTTYPQYNYLNSFKVFDPTVSSMSHHFEDSHQRRAEHDHYAHDLADRVGDFIHFGAVEQGEDWENMDLEELIETIAIQNFYLPEEIERTRSLLMSASAHFMSILDTLNEVELYDHAVTINQDLFQDYFNMSISLAKELNYLDQKDDELDKVLEEQVKSGDVAARNRRRQGTKQNRLEVNNKHTKLLVDEFYSIKSKVIHLNQIMQQMVSQTAIIASKHEVAQRLLKERDEREQVKGTDDRATKLNLIKSQIDFSDVEDIFDDIYEEQLNSGVFFSLVNMSMVAVMAISAYLWFKLNKAEI